MLVQEKKIAETSQINWQGTNREAVKSEGTDKDKKDRITGYNTLFRNG